MPTTEAIAAFVAWQARQADADKDNKGKGKQMAVPSPFPQAWGTKGKGKGAGIDPLLPRPRSTGRGTSRERRRDYGKRSRQDRDESMHERPRPCKIWGAWYVCRTAPENLARGSKHGHCSNPNCVRSFGRVHGQDVPVRDRPTQPDCFIIDDDGQQGRPAEPKAPPATAAALAQSAGARIPRTPDAAHSDTDVSRSALASPAPQIAAAAAAPQAAGHSLLGPNRAAWQQSVDWDAVQQLNAEGYHRWLLLQQVAAPVGPTPPQPDPPAGPWDRLAHLGGPAPVTPVVGAATPAPALAAAGPGEQLPLAPSPGLGADRPALPKGGPAAGVNWDEIPVVDIDDEPAAPAAKAAATPSDFRQTPKAAFKAPPPAHPLAKMPPYLPPVQLAQGGAAAAAAAPGAEPAEIPHPTAAQALERANAALRARETELREVERQLAIAMATSSEAQLEVQRLHIQCAGWCRQQKEQEANDAARDAELRELSRILAECEDRLAVARAMLRSLLER